ncbi:hypothetical protein RHSIM_Rhsim07G0034400 [Rhododendron simsii]|uniref:DUF1639 family protein n=1 Tax=Rhododendron simsii TaxID=118357 RepID=A0A834GUF7_RHOSS|nr:hypothetical protein RHSIM_Rhsim07G0034400 [Rhododendron simsii]
MSSPVPAKSQPLHNFSLPLLKWPKTHTNNQHHHRTGRRLAGSSPPPDSSSARRHSPARRQSPLLDSGSWRQSPLRGDSASESESGHASEHNRRTPAADTDHVTGQSEKKRAPADHVIDKSKVTAVEEDVDGAGVKEGKSKIYIRLRGKNKCDEVVQNDVVNKTEGGGGGGGGGEVDDLVGKSWNLRPRKPMRKLLSNGNGGGTFAAENNRVFSQQQTMPNRQEVVQTEEKKETKQKFSILLTRQEIEEDIFVMTGSKPARRPRKRAKVVQKQIDNVFPGLWLAAITPDSYKVSEAPAKV